MNKIGEIWRRLVLLTRREQLEEELGEEMRFHLEMKIQDNIEAGMSSSQARRAAFLQFGNRTLAREDSRELWGFGWLDRLGQDLRFGFRMLAKSPGFTAVVVLSLALGIGANTAIYSVVNTVLLRPPPFKDADRIALVPLIYEGENEGVPASAVVLAWGEEAQTLELASHASNFVSTRPLLVDGNAAWFGQQTVGRDIFQVLGAEAFLGRTFLPEDVGRDWSTTVVISHGMWQRVFGGDPKVIGQTLQEPGSTQNITGSLLEIVGVMPPDFWIYPWTADVDLWRANQSPTTWVWPIVRLKPSSSVDEAQSELSVIAGRVEKTFPRPDAPHSYRIRPFSRELAGRYGGALNLLLGTVAFVLLIGCVNVANLLLGRANRRHKEFATRAAVGAGRSRLVRQLMTESVLLSALGGLAGLAVAFIGIDLFILLAPHWYPPSGQISIDGGVLAYTLGISVLTAFLFGLAPALRASRPDLNASLKEGTRRSTGISRRRPLRVAVVAQTALAVTLLVGAGLMLSSSIRMLWADRGFESADVVAMDLRLTGSKYQARGGQIQPAAMAFYQRLLDRIQALPGVVSVGMTTYGPYRRLGEGGERLQVTGRPHSSALYSEVGGEYFKTLRIPLMTGRMFTSQNSETDRSVAIVNHRLAQQFFPGEDPVGKIVESPAPGETREIIGVVGNVVNSLREGSKPEIYVPVRQYTHSNRRFLALRKTYMIRTSVEPMSLAESLRGIVSELDNEIAPISIAPLESVVREQAGRPTSSSGSSEAQTVDFYTRLLSLFASLALFLTALGLYGVIDYSVSQRTHEFAIQLALGANRGETFRNVLKEGLALSLVGLGIGVAAALALGRLLESQLYGVAAADLTTFAVVAAVLIGVAQLAAYLPAQRAANVSPTTALRCD